MGQRLRETSIEDRLDRPLGHALVGVCDVTPPEILQGALEARFLQEAVDVRANAIGRVSTSIAGEADPVMHDAGGVSSHVRFEAAVHEHRHSPEHALVDTVDATVDHGDIGMLQKPHLGQP